MGAWRKSRGNTLLLAKRVWKWVGLERGAIAPSLTLMLPSCVHNLDCTLWYLEIPVSQTKTFMWETILSPKM